jgi:phage tail P2-like protein
MFESILPSNATPLEIDIERATAFADLPVEALASFLDPQKIDARFLPWLAFRLAVDFWNDDWSEQKKREVIAKQFNLIRLKGTQAGIAGMLEIVDSLLRQVVTNPTRVFASGTITKEQRDEWLSRMPQIRVYFASSAGTKGGKGFAGADGRAAGAFAGHTFAAFDAADAIYGRRAVLRAASGEEIPLRRSTLETVTDTRTAVEVERLHIPGKAGPALFAGGFVARDFITSKNKEARIVTYALDRSYDDRTSRLHLDTLVPGLDPIDVKYDRYADKLPRPALVAFISSFAGHCFASRDDAANHIYDRIYLHDKNVDVPWTKAHSFANHSRLGIKKFHAELLVESRSKGIPQAVYGGVGFTGRGFATKENLTKTKLAYAAVRRSKAARDRVKVDTQTVRPLNFGDRFKFGDGIKFGTRVRHRLR